MADDKLFGELPEQLAPRAEAGPRGAPRLREPVRDQVELQPVDIDSLIGQDHRARTIWAYVEGLDLGELEDLVKARDNRPGYPAPSPRLLLALWLYATSEGVGSARALDRLCESHDAYRWLCGGVSLNYHTLSDFRVGHADLLDRLLGEHLAALSRAGLVDLDALAQDGVRIRAHAGTGSFRRDATLDLRLAQAKAAVAALKDEIDADPDASNRRIKAARARAARERLDRVQAAQQALAEIADRRKRLDAKGGNGKTPKAPRASTTDPQARVMKMADAGFRPAYNVQVASAAGSLIVVDIDIDNNGSDRGLMRPMLQRLRARLQRLPRRHLVDGGYCHGEDIEWAHGEGTDVYCPPPKSRSGIDPYLPRGSDGPGVAAWRARMASDDGKAKYKDRSICECIHARWRNWNLRQLTVRGIAKARAVVLWYALANNILQGHRLITA